MNVTLEKTGNVNGIITVSIEENDYKEKVKKTLKELGQKRPLPGFRAGHVPAGILNKMYGKEALVEEVNRETYDALFKHIEDNKLNILGEPMIQNAQDIDFDNDKDFSFKFEVGFAPEFELKLDKDVKIPFYTIEVDQKMIDEQNESLRKRFGKQVQGEKMDKTALVKGSMVELESDGSVKEGGINVEATIVSPQYFKSDDERQKFDDKKVGDDVVFNPSATCEGNISELSSMLNLDKKDAAVESDFRLTIKEILVSQPAEMNAEFYENVFGKDAVKDEAEYYEKLKDMIARQLKGDSNYRFTVDAEEVLKAQVGKLELPAEFLKKWLLRQDDKMKAESIDTEYEKMVPQLEWQLIKEKAVKQLGVKVKDSDLLNVSKMIAYQQFAQYGMTNMPDDVIEKYAKEIMDNKDYRQKIVQQAVDEKLYDAMHAAVTLDEKSVSVDDFKALFNK